MPDVPHEKSEWTIVGIALDYRIRFYLKRFSASETLAYHGARTRVTVPVSFLKSSDDDIDIEKLFKEYEGLNTYKKRLWSSLSKYWDELLKSFENHPKCIENEKEKLISSLCIIFSYFDIIYRSGYVSKFLFEAYSENWSLSEMIENINQSTFNDLRSLSKLFVANSNTINNAENIEINPSFLGSNYVGGADADIIIDKCLWDIKTTIKPKKYFYKWPYQLFGYSFLDCDDKFQIRSVGIYLSRQGLWISWPLEELIHILGGNVKISLNEWRKRFRRNLK
jgi:hypothetical protein